MYDIKPVHRWKISSASQFLVCGSQIPTSEDKANSRSLAQLYVHTRKNGSKIWRASEDRVLKAVAMISVSDGNVGFLYHSPVGAQGVNRDMLTELIDRLSRDRLKSNVPIIQAFVSPDYVDDIEVLCDAGLRSYANLIDMVSYLGDLEKWRLPSGYKTRVSFVNGIEFGMEGLKEIIQSTYEGTLDCPDLTGKRDIDDIIESHRKTGIYTPQWWDVVMMDGKPVGCILINKSTEASVCRLVYIGIKPQFRGLGIGREMINITGLRAIAAGCVEMRVAVDSDNTPALRLYKMFGFQQTHVSNVLVRLST